MNTITCHIETDHLILYRDGVPIGAVIEHAGEPTIEFDVWLPAPALTFGDIEIIQDNWNVMKEMLTKDPL